MIKDDTTPIVIDIAKSFTKLMQGIEPKWNKAFLRFSGQDSVCEVKGSYLQGADVVMINALKHKNFFHPINDKGEELLISLGKKQGVFLLILNPNLEYEIKFEYDDLNRWNISKLDGGLGVPEGIQV
jgi:hypothetical protein